MKFHPYRQSNLPRKREIRRIVKTDDKEESTSRGAVPGSSRPSWPCRPGPSWPPPFRGRAPSGCRVRTNESRKNKRNRQRLTDSQPTPRNTNRTRRGEKRTTRTHTRNKEIKCLTHTHLDSSPPKTSNPTEQTERSVDRQTPGLLIKRNKKSRKTLEKREKTATIGGGNRRI